MILSHTHKFIFICNGKTGTSSMETALAQYQEGAEFEVGVDGLYTQKHVPPATLRAQLGPEIWDEYFSFVFVRNPWDWFVSQYFWNWDPDPISKSRLLVRPVSALREYRQKKRTRRRLRSMDAFKPEDIHKTYDLLRQYRGVYEAESLFQYYYVHGPSGEQLVDFVGRFEQIEKDFEVVARKIGLDVDLPHRNPTTHRSSDDYYTKETAELIGKLYHIDADSFGYSFGF